MSKKQTTKKERLDNWNEVKYRLHQSKGPHNVSERTIWWCSVGENIGVEVYGKDKDFLRPVLIIRKLNKYAFWAVPLTTKVKSGQWYVEFTFHGEKEFANLGQLRTYGVERLRRKMGTLDDGDFDTVIQRIRDLLPKNTPASCGDGDTGNPDNV